MGHGAAGAWTANLAVPAAPFLPLCHIDPQLRWRNQSQLWGTQNWARFHIIAIRWCRWTVPDAQIHHLTGILGKLDTCTTQKVVLSNGLNNCLKSNSFFHHKFRQLLTVARRTFPEALLLSPMIHFSMEKNRSIHKQMCFLCWGIDSPIRLYSTGALWDPSPGPYSLDHNYGFADIYVLVGTNGIVWHIGGVWRLTH